MLPGCLPAYPLCSCGCYHSLLVRRRRCNFLASKFPTAIFDASLWLMLAQAGQGMPRKLLEACLQRLPGTQKLSPGAVRARLGSQPLLATCLSAAERTQVPHALCCLRLGHCHIPCCMLKAQQADRRPFTVLWSAAISCILPLLYLRCLAGSLVRQLT